MRRRRTVSTAIGLIVLVAAAALIRQWLVAANTLSIYQETFDSPGEWDSGDDANTLAEVVNGQYEITVRASTGIFRGSSPQQFADGVYEVTATQLEGPLDNGYGLFLRLDSDENSFYMFEISGDGYAWAGLCEGSCDNQGWVEANAVNQGRNNPNQLRVELSGPEMAFFVNDELVTTFTDDSLTRGQAGFLVETFGGSGVKVAFDDFSVTPLPE